MTAGTLVAKRTVAVLVLVPTLLLLLSGTRTWVTGRAADPVLGGGQVSATGSQLAPGVMALGAVALAATVAMLSGGRRVRRISSVVLVLAAAGAVALCVPVAADPAAALGRVAAAGLGRIGGVAVTATPTGWLWVGLAAGVVLLLSGVVGVLAVGSWDGLSGRFERPGETDAADGRGARRTAWDELSEGVDPTAGPDVTTGEGRN